MPPCSKRAAVKAPQTITEMLYRFSHFFCWGAAELIGRENLFLTVSADVPQEVRVYRFCQLVVCQGQVCRAARLHARAAGLRFPPLQGAQQLPQQPADTQGRWALTGGWEKSQER